MYQLTRCFSLCSGCRALLFLLVSREVLSLAWQHSMLAPNDAGKGP